MRYPAHNVSLFPPILYLSRLVFVPAPRSQELVMLMQKIADELTHLSGLKEIINIDPYPDRSVLLTISYNLTLKHEVLPALRDMKCPSDLVELLDKARVSASD